MSESSRTFSVSHDGQIGGTNWVTHAVRRRYCFGDSPQCSKTITCHLLRNSTFQSCYVRGLQQGVSVRIHQTYQEMNPSPAPTTPHPNPHPPKKYGRITQDSVSLLIRSLTFWKKLKLYLKPNECLYLPANSGHGGYELGNTCRKACNPGF